MNRLTHAILLGLTAALLGAACLGGFAAAARAAPSAPDAPAAIPLDRPLRFERLTLADGLSQNSVFCALQDRSGYLWFGTQAGLNRYDGYTFTVYQNDPDDDSSLSDHAVISLAEDRDGMLWVGTWGGGLNRLDPASGRFTRYRHNPQDPASLSADLVAALLVDSQGQLWVATIGGGLDRFDPSAPQGGFLHARHDPQNPASLSSDAVGAILADPDGTLWLGTGGFGTPGAGLNRFDPQTGRVVRFAADPADPAALPGDTISAIQRAPDGALWVASGGDGLSGAGLARFDPSSGRAVRFVHDPANPASLASDNLLNLLVDPAGILWIASSDGGLDRLDTAAPASGFVHARANPSDPESLAADQVRGLLRDRSGVIWVGTLGGGLGRLNPQRQAFRLFRTDPADPASLAANAVGPLLEDRAGRIWVGTLGGGLDRYQPADGAFVHFGAQVAGSTITALAEDSQGALWVGSSDGLTALDPASGSAERYLHDPSNNASLRAGAVSALLEDPQGSLWVGTRAGLDRFERASRTFSHLGVEGLGEVTALLLDREGKLWVGTVGGGLFRLDPASAAGETIRVLERFQADPQNLASLSTDTVWAMDEDGQGALWLATSGGINRYDPAVRRFQHYREKGGPTTESAVCLLSAESGAVWASTSSAIARFDPSGPAFHSYQERDGLQGGVFNPGSCLQTRSGELFFGGARGLSAFRPADLQLNPFPPAVVITAFRIFNEPYPVGQSGGTPIRLSYRQNVISFEFAALDFRDPEQNQYAYQLEGFDRDWVQAGTRRYASYTNLSGGSYTFRVKASNNDEVWNETAIAIPLQITPPFWSSWWFLGGAGLLGLTALAAGLVWRRETLRDQTRRLESLVAERTITLRDTNQQLEVEVEQRRLAEEALARRAAEELRQSEARFRAMYENAAVGIALLSLERVVLECNEAVTQLFGYSPQAYASLPPDEAVHPEDREIDAEARAALVAGTRRSYQVEKRCRHSDGRYVWSRLVFSAVRGADGRPIYLLEMMVDIDEQKRVEQELGEQEANYRRLLEQRVYERTLELRRAYEQLQSEMEQRARAEEALALKAAEEAVLMERNRLARDLHDAVTQTLFSASLLAEVLPELFRIQPGEAEKRLEELRQLTRGALAEMRTLLVELRPSALTEVSLPELLRQLADATVGRARLPVQLMVAGEAALPPDVQVALYRIAQEALNNVVKYARATSASINLRLSPGSALLTVIDNGIGFDPDTVSANHFGLRIMRERAEAVGARIAVYSEPGHGTQVSASWASKKP